MAHYFDELVSVISALREPNTGCPWDLEQTHQSLAPYLIEESYELLHCLNENPNYLEMKEELGDVLLQILLHSQLASEKESFAMKDVCEALKDKMIRRHPHVFAEQKKMSIDELHQQWDQIKTNEGKKKASQMCPSILNQPSLIASNKIGERSRKIHFDWSKPEEVLEKVKEELSELENEFPKNNPAHQEHFVSAVEEEIGDVLFTMAQLSRHLGFNPEIALAKANKKFLNRFQRLLELAQADGKDFEQLSATEKEQYWSKVKSNEN